MKSKSLSTGFWQLADPKIWIASTVPMVLGTAMAVSFYHKFHLLWFILALIGVYLIEIGKNAINEFFDFKSGVDPGVDAQHRTPFSGGKKTIVDGLLTLNQSLWIGIITLGAAAMIGLIIVSFAEFKVLYIGLLGFGIAIIYSMPPFKLCYRGLGELAVGLTFGPLILNGMYVLLVGQFALLPIIASLPIAFIIVNVLWINQFPDYEADKAGNKKNWVVRLGLRRSAKVYGLLFTGAYLGVIASAIVARNPIWLLGLLSAPLAWQAYTNADKNYNDIPKLIASNAATVKIYVLTGLLLVVAAVLDGLFI